MFGEAGPKLGGFFTRENSEPIKMITFSVWKQSPNIQRDCQQILGNTEPVRVAEGEGVFGSELAGIEDSISQ